MLAPRVRARRADDDGSERRGNAALNYGRIRDRPPREPPMSSAGPLSHGVLGSRGNWRSGILTNQGAPKIETRLLSNFGILRTFFGCPLILDTMTNDMVSERISMWIKIQEKRVVRKSSTFDKLRVEIRCVGLSH